MSPLPEVRGWAALDPQSLSVATGQGLAGSLLELLITIVLVVRILYRLMIKAIESGIMEVVYVKVIVPPKRESQAAYEHPLQRQLDNPALKYSSCHLHQLLFGFP